MHVVVRRSGEGDEPARQRHSLRARQRRALLWLGPILAIAFVLQLIRLVREAQDDVAYNVVVAACTFLGVGLATTWWLHRQKQRATGRPGRIWSSRMASYPGPYDAESGGAGLVGSSDFARRHTANTKVPIVRLVLTPDAIEIVPTRGRNRPMSVPLDQVDEVELLHGDKKTRGITLRTTEGRTATFLVEPDDALAGGLEKLGATVVYR